MSSHSSNELQNPDLEKNSSTRIYENPTIIGQQDQTATLDWDGPEDPDNPRAWGFGKRLFHSVIPGLFNFVV